MRDTLRKAYTLLLPVLGLVAVVACDDGGFKNTGEDEEKVVAVVPEGAAGQKGKEDTPIAQAIYDIRVVANTGMELCKGRMSVLLSTNFKLAPTGSMKCLIFGDMDMAKMFGATGNVPLREDDMKQFREFGKIVRAQNPVQLTPGGAIFDPPKPSLIGPLIQDPTAYEGYVFSEKSRVQGISREGQPYQAQGDWYLKVLAINQSHQPSTYTGNLTFNNVIKWEMNAAGFENAPRAEFMGFDSMTYYWNTNPIAVPEIQIKSKLSDLPTPDGGGGGGLGGIGDMIFSGITINIKLIEHNPI